jgi:hypothetical protein
LFPSIIGFRVLPFDCYRQLQSLIPANWLATMMQLMRSPCGEVFVGIFGFLGGCLLPVLLVVLV